MSLNPNPEGGRWKREDLVEVEVRKVLRFVGRASSRGGGEANHGCLVIAEALDCRSIGRPSVECDHAREVIRDLEDEITMVLREAGYVPP